MSSRAGSASPVARAAGPALALPPPLERGVIRVGAVSLALFSCLGLLVRYGVLAWTDDRGVEWVQAHSPPWLYALGHVVGDLGGFLNEAVAVVALMALAAALRRFRLCVGLGLFFSTTAVEVLVKRFLYFPRADVLHLLSARPQDLPAEFSAILPNVETASFPSGHVARSTFLLGLALLLLVPRLRLPLLRLASWAAVALALALIGITRVTLDEHFPSDVVAGYLLGLMALSAALWLLRLPEATDHSRPAPAPHHQAPG